MGFLICIRRSPRGLASISLLIFVAFLSGCLEDSTSTSSRVSETVKPAKPLQQGPSRVELIGATAKLDDSGIVRFDIQYKFTSGSPTMFYQCDIKFSGTDRYGLKPMTADELEQSGSILTGIEVGNADVKDFEITLSEAVSPDQGYHLISNTLRGVVEPAE